MPQQFSHRLRHNARCEQPSSLVFVDTETVSAADPHKKNRQHHALRLGVAVAGRWNGKELSRRVVHKFTDAVEFWEWLRRRLSTKKTTWVYAHNWHFDATILNLWSLLDNEFFWLHRNASDGKCHCKELKPVRKCWRGICTIDYLPWILQVGSQFGRVNFVDTLNYWRHDLATLGRSINHHKLPMPDESDDDDTWLQYCERDTEIIERSVCDLMREWRKIDGGNWKSTVSSLAMANYQHKHLNQGLMIHVNPHVKKLEREAYFGGQISCWFRGEVVDETDAYAIAVHERLKLRVPVYWQPVYELDVRSLYPSVMLRHEFPARLVGAKNHVHVDYATELVNRYACIADCMVRVMGDGFPYRSGNVVTYPEGIYCTRLCQPELYRAFEMGAIVAVNRISWYETADLFSSFVNFWWARRKEALTGGNTVAEQLAKMMMNSLFGKFGQRMPSWVIRPDCVPPEPWCLWYGAKSAGAGLTQHRAIGWQDYSREGDVDGPNTFTAISAFVTSYGREYMRAIRNLCPRESVLYQHTDSLIVTGDGLRAIERGGLCVPDELGYFKTPVKITHAVLRGPNNVTINGADRVAGVGRSAQKVDDQGKELPDGEWMVNRVERLHDLLNPHRPIDGSIRWDRSRLVKPPCHTGMTEDYNGWWHYAPIV